MNRSRRSPIRKGLATGISVLMLVSSVAVPVLEQGALFHTPVVENEHNPGECPSGHDHTVCTQVGANLAIDGASVQSPEAPGLATLLAFRSQHILTARSTDRSNPSRAPPLV